MGFRFRKSFKVAPGVKFNLNKKSVGVTFGGKGAHYTVNSSGKKTTSVGIPGTGVYYTHSTNLITGRTPEVTIVVLPYGFVLATQIKDRL